MEIDWSTCSSVRRELPFCSVIAVKPANTTRMPAITASTRRDWRLSRTSLPKVTTSENGISSSMYTSKKLLTPLGFSKGCEELAL